MGGGGGSGEKPLSQNITLEFIILKIQNNIGVKIEEN